MQPLQLFGLLLKIAVNDPKNARLCGLVGPSEEHQEIAKLALKEMEQGEATHMMEVQGRLFSRDDIST